MHTTGHLLPVFSYLSPSIFGFHYLFTVYSKVGASSIVELILMKKAILYPWLITKTSISLA